VGRRLDSVYAAGSADSGQVGLALRFRHGATALVSYARGHDRDGGVDLLVVGNRGTVTYDATADPVGPGTAKAPTKLLALLKRALRSGRAEAAGDDEQP